MRKLLTLTLAAHLVAVSAGAQTDESAGEQTALGGIGPSSDPGAFGGDWSMILGSAMFDMDGRTVRSEDELLGQWGTLSEEDRDIIRRDCAVFQEQAGGTPSDGSAAPTGLDSTGAGEGTPEMGAAGSATGADAAADAAGTEPALGAGGATGTGATGTAGDAGTAQPVSPIMIDVSMEQMEEICAVLEDDL